MSKASSTEGISDQSFRLLDFKFISLLSKDVFGKTMLAEARKSQNLFAVKVLDKSLFDSNNEIQHIKMEKNVLLIANHEQHPFLTYFYGCFQTETHIFFVTECVLGGSLDTHIQRGDFSPLQAQFYAAEICAALKALHEQGILYRNLNLESILLTHDGHIKVTNFGLCKENIWHGSTTRTFCGTTEFMPPEVLLDKEYGRPVDWWGFGVILYQMLLHTSPFQGEDNDEIYDAILEKDPPIPTDLPAEAASILRGLFARNPNERLGSGSTDAQEIMSHQYFHNISWDDVYHKKKAAPFIPTIKDKFDTCNYDEQYTSLPPTIDPPHSVLTPYGQNEFENFDHTVDPL